MHNLIDLLNHDIVPLIPECGSVGASGDLAPLSYLAATLTGEATVLHRGRQRLASQALAAAGIPTLELQAKDALALMNGTSFMSAFAALAAHDARRLARIADICTALMVCVRRGRAAEFAPFAHLHKPHPGQRTSADTIHTLAEQAPFAPTPAVSPTVLAPTGSRETTGSCTQLDRHLQEPYSIRCAPHVIGVLHDTLDWVERWITTEINSSNDNPLIDADTLTVHNSGNFYGGHVAQAMDSLRIAAASVADLLDRQLQLIVDEKYSRGLPPNLAPCAGPETGLHHGFKGLQIAASALTAEALALAAPASTHSRSTEAHNQDKVSMGTIAARRTRDCLTLAIDVAAMHLLALCQAADLRAQPLPDPLCGVHRLIRQHSAPVTHDRPLHDDIATIAGLIRRHSLEDLR